METPLMRKQQADRTCVLSSQSYPGNKHARWCFARGDHFARQRTQWIDGLRADLPQRGLLAPHIRQMVD